MAQATLDRPPAHTVHPVQLTGLRASAFDKAARPLIVQRTDQDFIEGLLADLADPAARASLPASTPPRQGGEFRLYPPVQRVFNLLVLETFCDVPGLPPLDRSKIEGAGVVVRRVSGQRRLAWIKGGTRVFGWEPVDEDADPAAERRRFAISAGHPAINRLLPGNRRVATAGATRPELAAAVVTEQVYPLFVAPPDTCAAAKKTLLFATLPVTSDEQTESTPAAPAYGSDPGERADLARHLVTPLTAGGARGLLRPGFTFTTAWYSAAAQAAEGTGDRLILRDLEALLFPVLRQLDVEFDAFATGTTPAAMMTALNRITVEYDVPVGGGQVRRDSEPAGEFLKRARAVLMALTPGASFMMPHRWGAVSTTHAGQLLDAALACLDAQYRRPKPAQGRFDTTGATAARFVARCFIRLAPERPGCPGRLLWSHYTEPFTVAPWYESAGAAPTTVELPDLLDRAQLKKLKPNVSFVVPASIASLLKSDAKGLMEGKRSPEAFDVQWICGFSIPIITLCAFIVLNIFLQLLNLIFFWLPFLKICIPFPKRPPGPNP